MSEIPEINRDIVGAVIISSDDKVLLGKTGAYEGLWVVPGGGIEDGETKEDAMRREVMEETGLDVSDADTKIVPGVHSGQSEKTLRDSGERVLVKMRFFDFEVRFKKPASQINASAKDDFVEAEWFSKNELELDKLSPPTKKLLQDIKFLD
ncbi:NUDIX hydrolase [Candidatus Saccharibacteria bacterium]|nr:NUDIX hydrolase [Candidatus Saccharibacteria bacterium]